ncbi:nucleotide exchange factor GrpE [Patescibacteria group bacterium]|nr:nucleotide exchange factor GrpE [Patescibacteria group bacterium]
MDTKKTKKECKDCDKLLEEKAKLDERCLEMENNWKRALADFRNLQKRVEDERFEFLKYSNEAIIVELLGVMDNFEELLKHNDKDAGLKITINSFKDTLKRFGLEEVSVLGQNFDVATSECVEMVDGEKDKVILVDRKAYKLNGKVIRHARVKVGKGK